MVAADGELERRDAVGHLLRAAEQITPRAARGLGDESVVNRGVARWGVGVLERAALEALGAAVELYPAVGRVLGRAPDDVLVGDAFLQHVVDRHEAVHVLDVAHRDLDRVGRQRNEPGLDARRVVFDHAALGEGVRALLGAKGVQEIARSVGIAPHLRHVVVLEAHVAGLGPRLQLDLPIAHEVAEALQELRQLGRRVESASAALRALLRGGFGLLEPLEHVELLFEVHLLERLAVGLHRHLGALAVLHATANGLADAARGAIGVCAQGLGREHRLDRVDALLGQLDDVGGLWQLVLVLGLVDLQKLVQRRAGSREQMGLRLFDARCERSAELRAQVAGLEEGVLVLWLAARTDVDHIFDEQCVVPFGLRLLDLRLQLATAVMCAFPVDGLWVLRLRPDRDDVGGAALMGVRLRHLRVVGQEDRTLGLGLL